MDALAIAAEYLSAHDDAGRMHVLRSYTSYPSCLPHGEATLRAQLAIYQAASRQGLELCLGCGQPHQLCQLNRRGLCAPCVVSLRPLQAAA
jgi:hypothetical protein